MTVVKGVYTRTRFGADDGAERGFLSFRQSVCQDRQVEVDARVQEGVACNTPQES